MKIRAAKPEDAREIARVMVDTWRTTYAGIVPDAFLQSLCYEQREARWLETLQGKAGERYTYVAEQTDGRIIGYISGGPERTGEPDYPGELYAIYIDPAWQSQGIGRLLVAALAEGLVAAGLISMLVWVIAANPSRRFYERLGGRYVREQQIDIGGERLDTVAYGWSNVNCLIV